MIWISNWRATCISMKPCLKKTKWFIDEQDNIFKRNSREVFQILTKSASIKANPSIILSCRRCTELWFIPTSRKWREISLSHVYANKHASCSDKSNAMTKIRCNETNEKTNDRWLNRWIPGRDFARDRSPRRVCTDDIRLLIVLQIKFRDDSTRIAQ